LARFSRKAAPFPCIASRDNAGESLRVCRPLLLSRETGTRNGGKDVRLAAAASPATPCVADGGYALEQRPRLLFKANFWAAPGAWHFSLDAVRRAVDEISEPRAAGITVILSFLACG
jgi:hypothetical protein